jgi:hypothetical protein
MQTAVSEAQALSVSADNFIRAESNMYFEEVVKEGGFGQFEHHRGLMSIEKQTGVRANRDTLYSAAVFVFQSQRVGITRCVSIGHVPKF